MRPPEPNTPEALRRSKQAAEWLVRRDRGLGAAEQDEFLQWLALDPRHGEWFALHRTTVADFTALTHWRPEHGEAPNPDLLAPARRRVRWLAPLLLATAAAIAVIVTIRRPGTARVTPSVGPAVTAELERRLLEDGSSIELNRGAVVRTAFTANERHATLVSGEAYFTIAKDPRRPFIVRAGGVDVRAVGTAFSVRVDAGAVEVLVTEGRVGVTHEQAHADSPKPAVEEEATMVDAGQRATVSLTTIAKPQVSEATPAQVSRHLTWQPQLLDFSSAPLSLAVAEFNRRNIAQFEIADADLAALPIVASIRSDNVDGFAQFLAGAPGVMIERRGPSQIVVRRRR